MLSFGYTENIVINIHFIKAILVREETHLQKSIFFALPEKITDGISIVDLVYCCCTSACLVMCGDDDVVKQHVFMCSNGGVGED